MTEEGRKGIFYSMKIGFIGAGNMGQALAGGILQAGVAKKESIRMSDIDMEKLKAIEKSLEIKRITGNSEIAEWADTIVLAVKPGIVSSVLKEITSSLNPLKLLICIAAGVKIADIEKFTGEIPVIRAMPNTPALINQGATAIARGSSATQLHMEKASSIFSAVGIVVSVDEAFMDAVTALSGSGPAYVFFMAEAMEEAARRMNLPPEAAQKLVRGTILGSAKMLAEVGADPADLRKKVTSPGGTTEAALRFLEKHNFREALIGAIHEAASRSKELGKGG